MNLGLAIFDYFSTLLFFVLFAHFFLLSRRLDLITATFF